MLRPADGAGIGAHEYPRAFRSPRLVLLFDAPIIATDLASSTLFSMGISFLTLLFFPVLEFFDHAAFAYVERAIGFDGNIKSLGRALVNQEKLDFLLIRKTQGHSFTYELTIEIVDGGTVKRKLLLARGDDKQRE